MPFWLSGGGGGVNARPCVHCPDGGRTRVARVNSSKHATLTAFPGIFVGRGRNLYRQYCDELRSSHDSPRRCEILSADCVTETWSEKNAINTVGYIRLAAVWLRSGKTGHRHDAIRLPFSLDTTRNTGTEWIRLRTLNRIWRSKLVWDKSNISSEDDSGWGGGELIQPHT